MNKHEKFIEAMCAWNHSKNLNTFKSLLRVAGIEGTPLLRRIYFIIKNTLSGKYKKIEKDLKNA